MVSSVKIQNKEILLYIVYCIDVKEATWAGSSIQEIYDNLGPWHYHSSPISVSKYHTVLYELPAVAGQIPKPHYNKQNDWDGDHVRMPYSPKNLFPVKNVNCTYCYD